MDFRTNREGQGPGHPSDSPMHNQLEGYSAFALNKNLAEKFWGGFIVVSMFQRIDTVFLNVKNFSESIEWYKNVLGFEAIWRDDEGGYAALGVSETPLTLRRVSSDGVFRPTTESAFNFYVADAAAAHKHLREANAIVGDIHSEGQVTWFTFQDLDGNCLEICSF